MLARLTREEVARIADLARLELPEADLDRLARELTDILTFAGQIAAVDTSDVDTAAAAGPADAHLRPDVPRPSLLREDALAQAPAADAAGCFTVPRVIP
jgi:aspartyl-tRNA(Asn)/glutamyl-tRNA(Gln) amidotransferase subunit C